MSAQGLQDLLDLTAKDQALKEQLESVTSPNEVVVIAAERGITVTIDDFEPDPRQLSEQELAGVSGGAGTGTYESFSLQPNSLFSYGLA